MPIIPPKAPKTAPQAYFTAQEEVGPNSFTKNAPKTNIMVTYKIPAIPPFSQPLLVVCLADKAPDKTIPIMVINKVRVGKVNSDTAVKVKSKA